MATRTKKTTPRSRAMQPKAPVDSAPKDVKPSFGKAAPRKVVPGAVHKVSAKPAKAHKPAAGKSGPIRTVASVATGAVVATARLAASVLGRGGKAKAKTK
ncbi:hypothetical protein [Mesorhizobium sp.]|uniref:hypothetical protein n=1 Tax=Mesorhizobium sp. TaxID=1871066 RepID=UPI0025EEA8DD|nr:hypothetical protein [Mesorhizobium sp.]